MARNEHRLYQPILTAGKRSGWALYRIEDAGSSKRPFDIGGSSPQGQAVAIEVKWLDGRRPAKAPEHALAPHQYEWLRGIADRGGLGILAVYSEAERMMDLWGQNGERGWVPLWVCEFTAGGGLKSWPDRLLSPVRIDP